MVGVFAVGLSLLLVLISFGIRFMVALLLSFPATYLSGWAFLLMRRAWLRRQHAHPG
jgi:hypothetical protein